MSSQSPLKMYHLVPSVFWPVFPCVVGSACWFCLFVCLFACSLVCLFECERKPPVVDLGEVEEGRRSESAANPQANDDPEKLSRII